MSNTMSYRCPICKSATARLVNYDETRILEDDVSCTFCRMYEYEYLYGGVYTRYGFCDWRFVEQHIVIKYGIERHIVSKYRRECNEEQKPALAESIAMRKHSDWRLMRTLPLFMVVDWLHESGFYLQEKHLRKYLTQL